MDERSPNRDSSRAIHRGAHSTFLWYVGADIFPRKYISKRLKGFFEQQGLTLIGLSSKVRNGVAAIFLDPECSFPSLF